MGDAAMAELMGELLRIGFLLVLWAFGIWVGGSAVAAWVAWERGREPVAWFVLAFFLSPLVGRWWPSARCPRITWRAGGRGTRRGET